MDGVLRKKIIIDEDTGKPRTESQKLETLFNKSIKRKDIIDYFKDRAKIINQMDD